MFQMCQHIKKDETQKENVLGLDPLCHTFGTFWSAKAVNSLNFGLVFVQYDL